MATNSRRLVRFSILGIAGTIAFASVANADPVGVALVGKQQLCERRAHGLCPSRSNYSARPA